MYAFYFLKNLSPKILKSHFNQILIDDAKIAETFNSSLKNVVTRKILKKDESILWDTGNETDAVKISMKKYKRHPSILRIKQLMKNPTEFYFALIDKDPIAKEIKNLNLKKAIPKDDIKVKLLKLN